MITKLVNILGLLSAGTAAVRADIDCSDFSVGKCNTNQENIIDTKKIPENLDFGISVDTCQKICTSIAGCNYMSYDESTRDCTLMNHDIHNGYLSSCDLISGPSSPTLVECDELKPDSCQLFVRENCQYTGDVMYSSKDVLSAVECQVLLQGIGAAFGAELWIHDALVDNLCEFRSTKAAECTGINGPQAPSYLECSAAGKF